MIVGELHRDRGAGGVDEGKRTAPAIEKADRVAGEEVVGQRQVAAFERDRLRRLAQTRPPGAITGTSARSSLLEAHERARRAPRRRAASGSPDGGRRRTAPARSPGLATSSVMSSASSLRRYSTAKVERERIERAGALVVAQRQADEVGARGFDWRKPRSGRSRADRADRFGRRPVAPSRVQPTTG